MTRHDNDVTLSHGDADTASRLLSDYASKMAALAHNTRSEAVRYQANKTADDARRLANDIVARLFTWSDQ